MGRWFTCPGVRRRGAGLGVSAVQVRRLGAFDGSRCNNLPLLWLMLTALLVLGSGFAVTASGPDPVSRLLSGHSSASGIAFHGLFALAGFVAAAGIARHGVKRWALGLVLRIYPALIACVLLTVFVLGPAVTSRPLASYFADTQTWEYLLTASLVEAGWNLPGVFDGKPYSSAVNEPLWVLAAGIRCAILALAAGAVGLLAQRSLATVLIFGLALLLILWPGYFPFIPPGSERLLLFFLLGMTAWLNRDRLVLHPLFAALAIAVAAASLHTPVFDQVFPFCLVYLLLYAAFALPPLGIGAAGDIAYGIFLYAWPIQQLLVAPGQTGYANAALAAPLAIGAALLSRKLIEQPALALLPPSPPREEKPAATARSRRRA